MNVHNHHPNNCSLTTALKFFKTCVAMKFVDDDDDDDDDDDEFSVSHTN